MSNDLRAVVIIDYQNVHLVGANLYPASQHLGRHESLIDPLLFAQQLLHVRNVRQRPGYPAAVLSRVLVYRGLPHPENDPAGNRRNLAQQVHWERDTRVSVTLRPLKYTYERDATGRPVTDVHGKKTVLDQREKGIDVLCALAMVREAHAPDTDLVILASTDSDLEPAVEEVYNLKQAKIETCSWYYAPNPGGLRGFELRPVVPIWNTRMDQQDFVKVRDHTDYL